MKSFGSNLLFSLKISIYKLIMLILAGDYLYQSSILWRKHNYFNCFINPLKISLKCTALDRHFCAFPILEPNQFQIYLKYL